MELYSYVEIKNKSNGITFGLITIFTFTVDELIKRTVAQHAVIHFTVIIEVHFIIHLFSFGCLPIL